MPAHVSASSHPHPRDELDRAEMLEPEDMPADVVTRNTRVRFADVDSGAASEVSLVFPRHADAEADFDR